MKKLQFILKNAKTSVMAIVPLLLTIMVAMGWIDLEQQTFIQEGVPMVLDSTNSILNEVISVTTFVTGIGLLFAKDGDKTSEDIGLKKNH